MWLQCDYIRSIWIIQDNLPILRFITLIPSAKSLSPHNLTYSQTPGIRGSLFSPWHLSTQHLCFFFFLIIYFNWRLITLQYCSGFCHTSTWISLRHTFVLLAPFQSQRKKDWWPAPVQGVLQQKVCDALLNSIHSLLLVTSWWSTT